MQTRPGERRLVGVGKLIIARAEDAVVRTNAIGASIALTAFEPETRFAALLHFALPGPSRRDAVSIDRNPYIFATWGFEALLERAAESGIDPSRLVMCAAGGAETFHEGAAFDMGRRNRTMLRRLLWRSGLELAGSDLGGHSQRVLTLNLGTGAVTVSNLGQEVALWSP